MLSASQSWPPWLADVTFLITDTRKLLTKKPRERVVKKRPVLMVFMLFGDWVRKKSSWPVYMKASPDPTRKNCGIRAETAIPTVERTRPSAILCKLVNPACMVDKLL
nr:hypothetical protein ACMD2_20683 [Ipomoea trifida]